MPQAWQIEPWRDVYVMLGTTAGALIGLLFVATSLHLAEIVSDKYARTRARNNLLYLLCLVATATVMLLPQAPRPLGIELLLIYVCLFIFHARNFYMFRVLRRHEGTRVGFSGVIAVQFFGSDAAGVVGATFIYNAQTIGLYLVAAAYFLYLSTVVFNTWQIMLWVGRSETKG